MAVAELLKSLVEDKYCSVRIACMSRKIVCATALATIRAHKVEHNGVAELVTAFVCAVVCSDKFVVRPRTKTIEVQILQHLCRFIHPQLVVIVK